MHLKNIPGIKRVDALAGLTKEKLATEKVYNVRHFGASGNGLGNDAPAINKAINACSDAGGGTVVCTFWYLCQWFNPIKKQYKSSSGCRCCTKSYVGIDE